VKKRNAISSMLSALLTVLLLTGSTGAVIVRHNCFSCGLSDFHTEIFSTVHDHHACDCEQDKSLCHNHEGNAMEQECCTFTSEKLSLTDYNKSTLINLSIVSLPLLSCRVLPIEKEQEKPFYPIEIHNKHGGRDVLISNCQFII
jgi:hypothetical protein